MKTVFVDTSALIAIGNRRDFFHPQAISVRNYLKETKSCFVITNAVLLEFGNAFSSLSLKPAAVKLIEAVRQSAKWSGYNEIQDPRTKNILIDYEKLRELFGVGSYDEPRSSHRGWVEESLGSDTEVRRDE